MHWAKGDNFVKPHHGEIEEERKIQGGYGGDKEACVILAKVVKDTKINEL